MRWQDELRREIERLTAKDFNTDFRGGSSAGVEITVARDVAISLHPLAACINSRPVAGVAAECLMFIGVEFDGEERTATFEIDAGAGWQPAFPDDGTFTKFEVYKPVDFNEL